ncbi:MAG: rhodanese-like domain-containing protein [Gammaproteobacteria bacterium]|jgi:rhodanese-related sulfurtransferase
MQQLIDFAANNAILVIAFFVLLGLLLRTYITPGGAKSVTASQAVQLINHEDALLLDVRTQEEFQKSHILNAINIPLGLLDSRIADIQEQKARPVVVVCQSGSRSQQAARTLKKHAFDRIHNLSGGMLSWQQANLPVESNSKGKSNKGQQKGNKAAG